MARISQYEQDSTLNKLDKVVGTDSATGATKNYTIDSMIGLVNSEDLVNIFDGVSYAFKSYEAGSTNPRGIINLNAGAASNAAFSAINIIYISILDKHGNSIANYLDDTVNSFIRIVQKTNIDTYGVFEVTAVANHDSGAYKKLTVTPRINNGNIVANEEYFISNYSAVFDQDFSDDSVTEFSDVSNAGSGQIITNAERTSLNNFTANGLVHADVVNNVTSTATNVPLSAAQGKALKDLIDAINTLLTSDNTDLDSLQEVVDFIEANKDTLDNLSISNIAGLQAALDAKQNTETGKGLSTNDFTTALLNKLNGIAAGAQVNVKPSWTAGAGTDAEILNKPTDLTVLSTHNVTELSDVTSAGSGSIISSAERTKLNGIATGAEVNVQANWGEGNASSDAFIQNKPDLTLKADKATTIQVAGTTNEIEVSPTGAQDLSANRTFTVGLPNDVTIGGDLKVNETIELVNAQSSTPTFDNGIYYSTENGHDTLHFRYDDNDLSIDYLTENIPTGILNGGVLSTNTNTTFDIAAGDGIVNILNKDGSEPHPEIKKVSWGATTVTHTLGDAGNANQLNTWIYVNSAGTVVQTLTTPTPSIWRNNIVLGSVIHSSNVIRFVRTFPRPAYSNGNTVSEFIEVFGPLKKSGHLLTVNSSNTMRLDRSAGVAFALGRNYQTNAEEPNISSDGASTPVFHRYSSTATGFTKDNGTGGAGYTAIDPTKYDNNGTLTTVSSGQYTVQRLYHFPNNTSVIVAYYGKAQYASIDEAEKNYLLENFQEADNTAQQAIYLGALILKGNATNLGNSAQAKILTGGIFRSLSATNLGGVAADAAINDLTDVNITGVANNELLKYNSSTGNWENDTITSDEVTQGSTNIYYPSTDSTKVGYITVTQAVNLDTIESDTAANNAKVTFPGFGTTSTTALVGNTQFVNGTGTAGKLPKFSDSDTLADSVISESGQIVDVNINGAIKIPDGITGERPTSPAAGMFRYNTTDNQFEGYTNQWGAIGGGIIVQEEGSSLSTAATTLNFTGSAVTASGNGAVKTINVTGGGSSGSTVTIEKNVYTGDGSDLTFNTTTAIVNENNVQVYIDGVYQSKDTYTTSSSTVTFGSGNAPANGASVELIHMVSVDAVIARDSFTGNGSTTAYVLSKSISNENATQVYLDGVYQSKNNYSTSGSTLTFSTAPPNGTAIEVVHIKASVDSSTQWQSSIKTADFSASAGEGYFVNTTSGTVTVSLPAGSVGDEIHFTDYASTFDTNEIIFDANGSQKIQGRTTNAKNATEGATVRLIYQDDIKGWTGNILDIPNNFALSYLVVAGGGGGGHVGGGGAGGYRTNYGGTALTLLPNTNYTVTVGAGGTASTSAGNPANAASGSTSVFSTISSAGGGYGAANYTWTNGPAASGGSGGGGPWDGTQASHHLGGSGNTPSTSPSQGNNGGSGHTSHPNYSGGGGGGASAVGTNGTGSTGGTGGAGSANSITGSSVTYAGGGGGNGMLWGGDGTAGSGVAGGGGNGSKSNTGSVASGSAPSNGTANLGGGGGSPGYTTTGVGAGGSGVVIVRYPSNRSVVIPGGSGLVTSQLNATVSGSTDKYTTFPGGTGTIQFS